MDRRRFLKGTLGMAGTAFAIGGTKITGQVLGANDIIRIAVSGIHSRGGAHINEFSRMKGVAVVALVDPDSRTFAERIEQVQKAGGKEPRTFQDIRKALEQKDIDVLTIATTNHWHSLQTIWACQAGKDVYVEKPLSHNVYEGWIAVQAARKYNRIVQHGTQGRSSRSWWQLAEIAKKGTYGKLLISRALCYKPRASIGFRSNETPPKELAYDLWLGPAPEQPYNTNLVHYNWHWFWDFGNGDIGNQGVHQMDVARWMIPDATCPQSAFSLGGRFGYKDQGETPNTQIAVINYGETQLIFEVRGLPTDGYRGEKIGNILHFEEGVVAGNRFYRNGSQEPQDLPRVEVELGPGGGHFGNFIAAVRSRKQSDLNADVRQGSLSCIPIHLANISYRLGEKVAFDQRTKALGENEALRETFGRMVQHLKDNKVDPSRITYQMGRELKFDCQNARITGDPEATKMLTREYRKPFVVPERIT